MRDLHPTPPEGKSSAPFAPFSIQFSNSPPRAKRSFAISPNAFFARYSFISRPLRIEGAGNAGRPMRPAVSCARWNRKRTRAYRSHRNHPAFPTQWLTDYTVLSPVLRAFWPPSPALLNANLTPASGCQDHTSSPSASAPFVIGASASTASRPAAVTIATRPSVGRDGCEYACDLGLRKNRIFFRKGLDRSGKSPRHAARRKSSASAR